MRRRRSPGFPASAVRHAGPRGWPRGSTRSPARDTPRSANMRRRPRPVSTCRDDRYGRAPPERTASCRPPPRGRPAAGQGRDPARCRAWRRPARFRRRDRRAAALRVRQGDRLPSWRPSAAPSRRANGDPARRRAGDTRAAPRRRAAPIRVRRDPGHRSSGGRFPRAHAAPRRRARDADGREPRRPRRAAGSAGRRGRRARYRDRRGSRRGNRNGARTSPAAPRARVRGCRAAGPAGRWRRRRPAARGRGCAGRA